MLIVMFDQVAPSALGCYGNPVVKAPTIDRLAREGVVFDAAYSNSPLCTPARYCMMTGQLPSATRGYDNAAYLASTIPTFAHYLRSAGYRTVLDGKMHFVGPDQLHGFEERRTTDIYPADFGWTPDWLQPDERVDWWFHNMDAVTQAGVAEVTNQLLFDDEVGHTGVRALHELARDEDERPWMLVVSFTHPHDPYVTRRQYWDAYEGVDIPMPRIGAGDVPLDPHTARLRQVSAMDQVEITDHDVRRARRAYYGNIYLPRRVDRTPDLDTDRSRRGRRHRGRAAGRPRRHARRARALVQDELLRGLRARPADRAQPDALRPWPGGGTCLPGRRAPDTDGAVR